MYKSIFLVVFILLASSCSKETTGKMEQLLVGTWELKVNDGLMSAYGLTEYRVDKTCSGKGSVKFGSETINMTFSAKWKIEKGYLIVTVTETSLPDMIAVGDVMKDEILQLDEESFTYKDEEGGVYTEKRKK